MTNAATVRQFNVVLLGNLVAGGLTSPGVNKYEATLTAYMPGTFTIHLLVVAPYLQVLSLKTYPSLGAPLACATQRLRLMAHTAQR